MIEWGSRMLVEMKTVVFYSLNDFEIGWACIEPTIQKVRGKDLTIKSQVYNLLTSGQQSLFMFWVLYGHSRKGIVQFYNEMNYLIKNGNIWSELEIGMRYFDDEDMLKVLKEMENMYHILQRNQLESSGIEIIDLDSELQKAVDQLNQNFQEVIHSSFEKIGKFIRKNQDEFVYLVN